MPEFTCKISGRRVEYLSLKNLNPYDFKCLDKIIDTDGDVCCKLLDLVNSESQKCPKYYKLIKKKRGNMS